MRLFLIDSGLGGEFGHHIVNDVSIAHEFRRRGYSVTVFCYSEFPKKTIEDIRFSPFFRDSCYLGKPKDTIAGAYKAFVRSHARLREDFERLPKGMFLPDDIVIVTTTTERHMLGTVEWMKSFDPKRCPLFVILLFTPSGVAVAQNRLALLDPFRACFYRVALEEAVKSGVPVHVLAAGEEFAKQYSFLAKRRIRSLPLLAVLNEAHISAPLRKNVLLFAGVTRASKGIHLVPEVVQRLNVDLPDWTLRVAVEDTPSWALREPVQQLRELEKVVPKLDLRTKHLASAEYVRLLSESEIVLLPYSGDDYRMNASGILWESIFIGRPVVVPGDTQLEYEARHWGAAVTTFERGSAASIAAAVVAAAKTLPESLGVAAAAADRYRGKNGIGKFADMILHLQNTRALSTSRAVPETQNTALHAGANQAGLARAAAARRGPQLERLIFHGTHHKTGTVWFKKILSNISKKYDLNFYSGDQEELPPDAEVFFQMHSIVKIDELPVFRGTHMIRDPRDVIISGYFYHLDSFENWLHVRRAALDGQSYQERLRALSVDEGLIFEIDHRGGMTIRDMLAWNYGHPDILELKYEEVMAEHDSAFERIFVHYGFETADLGHCVDIARNNHLSRQEKSMHIRSGAPDQWRSQFTPRVNEYFQSRFPDAVSRLGYEML